MGVVGIFNLAIRCFDLLAWPLLALGYPLRASIMAIETNSDLETRKLVTYWIIFSLISLFEHAFVKLLEWIPLWLYIKLMIICWLVIPHFDGSYYVYMHAVRPCLSMETQTVVKQLKKLKEIYFERKDFSSKRDNFIDEVEKFVKENGPEALENLIASESKFKEDVVTQKDIKAVEATEDKNAVEATEDKKAVEASEDKKAVEASEDKKADVTQKVFQPKVKSVEANISTHAPAKIKRKLPSASMGFVELPASDNVQKEWTCAICQVTTKSEDTLNSHLQGRRHRATFEKLNANNQNVKIKVPPASVEKKSTMPKVKPEKSLASSTAGHKMQVKPNNVKHDGVVTRTPGLWCFVCNVGCSSMNNMHSHLKGKMHLNRISELNGVAGGVRS